jgi:hypothetical protein
MAQPLKIAWKHPAEVFYQLYKQEVDARIGKRWQALWMLRRGERWKRVKAMGGSAQADSAGTQGMVWDHAAFHKAKVVGEVGLRRIYQPPYFPELNPAERVFAEVRRWVEGRRYERIEAKKAAVEAVLRRLEDEGKVSSLVGWRYIRQTLNVLPSLGALAERISNFA